jgi:tRNA-dihydrouridine synthase 3
MEILPLVHRCGFSAVTIHGRTRQQRYTKSADWGFIRKAATYAKEQLNGLPVIANGDVYSFEDYEEIVKGSDVTTTMIARGALVKPWSVRGNREDSGRPSYVSKADGVMLCTMSLSSRIFTEIKERRHWDISASERLDLLRDFVRYGHEHFGTDTRGVENTRRYLLEMLSFLHRYVPVGLLERPRVSIQQKNVSNSICMEIFRNTNRDSVLTSVSHKICDCFP